MYCMALSWRGHPFGKGCRSGLAGFGRVEERTGTVRRVGEARYEKGEGLKRKGGVSQGGEGVVGNGLYVAWIGQSGRKGVLQGLEWNGKSER